MVGVAAATVEVALVVVGVDVVAVEVVVAAEVVVEVVAALVVAALVVTGDEVAAAAGVVVLEDAAEVDDVDAAGLTVSLGSPLANGLRGMLAMSALTDTVFGACTVGSDVVKLSAGGAGAAVAVPVAGALLSSSSGMAMRATSSNATTTHSLRSIRSRRSELIISLRSCWPRP